MTPSDGDTNADPTGTIRIEFSEELDATTVSSDTITLYDGNNPVAGTIAYNGTRVTFKPDKALALLVPYTLDVRAAISDVDGVKMLEDFAATFAVRDGTWDKPEIAPVSGSLGGVSADADGNFMLASNGEVDRYSLGSWTTSCETCWGAMAGNGRGEMVTATVDGNGVVTARQYRNGAWQADAEEICELTGYVPQAIINVSMSPSGEAHVAIRDDFTVRTRQTDSDGAWSNGTDTPEWSDLAPRFAFNDAGDGFVYWNILGSDDHALRVIPIHEGSAGAAETVPSSETSGTNFQVEDIAVTNDGGAMATWLFSGSLFVSHYFETRWATAQTIPGSANVNICTRSSLISDGDDFVLAWGHDQGTSGTPCVLYTSRWHEGKWGSPELRSDASTSVDDNPSLHVDAHGNLLLLWTVGDQLSFARYNSAVKTWTAPRQAFFNTLHHSTPTVAVSPNGTAMMAYYDTDLHQVYTALFQ